MANKAIRHTPSFFYPPGGILIQIVILTELLTFGAGMATMTYYSRSEATVFRESCILLSVYFPIINTILLLSSGLFLAISIKQIHEGKNQFIASNFKWSIILGLGFIIIKTYEYATSILAGHTLGENTFYNFYWFLTGFHYIHVWAGLIILLIVMPLKYENLSVTRKENIEAAAGFWHFCDLVWVLLFPTVYFLFR